MSANLLKKGLYQQLASDSQVSSRVGDRIYSVYAPQFDSTPFIVFSKTGATRTRTHDGLDGYTAATFDVGCWAASETEADSLGDAVREALCGDGFRTQFGDAIVQHCEHVTERDEIAEVEGKEKPLYAHVLTVTVAYSEGDME